MSTFKWPAGRFCWLDLATNNVSAAKTFYSQLFRWETEDVPMPGGVGDYTMARIDSDDVCGMYALNDEMKTQKVPPHWLSYISVNDVDKSAARAKKLGAMVIQAPFDIPETGRMALIKDPTGAVVALWQSDSPHAGAARFENVPGTLCWTELITDNIDMAGTFYGELLGWTPVFMNEPMPYTVFRDGKENVAGMMAISDEMQGVPPNWSSYFAVESCKETASLASKLGAKTIVSPTTIPGTGTFACFLDPQGAVFNILEPEPM